MLVDQQTASKMLSLLALVVAGCSSAPVEPTKAVTYARDMCGGLPVWSARGAESGELMTYNHLEVLPSAILWNGVVIDRATLDEYLGKIRALNPQPVTALVPKPTANCGDVLSIRQKMEDRLSCSVEKTCVEYSEADWSKRHPPVP